MISPAPTSHNATGLSQLVECGHHPRSHRFVNAEFVVAAADVLMKACPAMMILLTDLFSGRASVAGGASVARGRLPFGCWRWPASSARHWCQLIQNMRIDHRLVGGD